MSFYHIVIEPMTGVARFKYQNHEGKIEERTVTGPFELEFGANSYYPQPQWFLCGHCVDRQARRSFALNRIVMPAFEEEG